MMLRSLAALLPFVFLMGCAGVDYRSNEFRIGSAVSRNIFVDANQFTNRIVKVRLRNSSGDQSIDVTRIRSTVEAGLRSAGYEIGEEGYGIVLDVNLYFMNSVATGRQSASNEVGILLGGVAGYETAKRPGGLSVGSGVILGAIAGSTLQDVLRANSEYDSFVAICDVNIGVVRQRQNTENTLVIGGNRFGRDTDDRRTTFESFAQRETVKVYVYAGDKRDRHAAVIQAIEGRLAHVVSNLI